MYSQLATIAHAACCLQMLRTPNLNWLFHTRMVLVSMVLAATDGYLIYYAVNSVTTSGPSMQLLFGFEVIRCAISC